MSSGRGIDPGEPEAMQFVITESLLSLGVIPQIHLGTNFTVVDMTRHTIIAVVETGESEPSFSIEVKKAELWRAVVLESEMGLGLNVPTRGQQEYSMAARALREEAKLRLRLDESLRRWQLLASAMRRAAALSRAAALGRVRMTAEGGRGSEMGDGEEGVEEGGEEGCESESFAADSESAVDDVEDSESGLDGEEGEGE
eukprot:jgi/Chrpa1/24584/Chrysochromulina_OHIO_Genome00024940-RA